MFRTFCSSCDLSVNTDLFYIATMTFWHVNLIFGTRFLVCLSLFMLIFPQYLRIQAFFWWWVIIIIIIIIMNSSAVSFFQNLGRRISQNSVLFRDSFCCPGVPGRFRCIATPAFDFNFFELLTLGIFTTEGKKIIIIN